MTADFSNGLSIVPLSPDLTWWMSASFSPVDHPFRPLLYVRHDTSSDYSNAPETLTPLVSYGEEKELRQPATLEHTNMLRITDVAEVHETVRLLDIEEFRRKTSVTVKRAHVILRSGVARPVTGLNSSPYIHIRPVIYRYVDIVKNAFALLEAIHFELFLPDRPDLRFLAVSITSVPSSYEGDYFHVREAVLLKDPTFAVKLGVMEYPVVWEVRAPVKMVFSEGQVEQDALAYIMKKKQDIIDGEMALSILHPSPFLIRSSFFDNPSDRQEDSLLMVSMRPTSAAHLYPVEPLIPVSKAPRSDSYIARVRDVRTSAQRFGLVVTDVRELTDAETARINDRFDSFSEYDGKRDIGMMHEMFRLGCKLRETDSPSGALVTTSDAAEIRIDDAVILKTLTNPNAGSLSLTLPLLDAIYGRSDVKLPCFPVLLPVASHAAAHAGLLLNTQQARAVAYYTSRNGPRVFCIHAPPGSGKTTVAAAMAAAVARNTERKTNGPKTEVQLLLSVQNVAVDGIGAALKKMDYGGEKGVYNLKSAMQLDPFNPAPFDFFDLADDDVLNRWRVNREELDKEKRSKKYTQIKADYFTMLGDEKRQIERNPEVTHRIILSTVESLLLHMQMERGSMRTATWDVKKVIIDEASLLTEAALFCLMRRFPKAQFVLIGDDQQLPPFLYDEHTLGAQLAGRSALSVAMKTGKVPVVELVDVYRAPPTLVEPYNRLAYGGKLESRVPEGEKLLSKIGLIHADVPQLLLINVDGKEQLNHETKSFFNLDEIKAVQRLLKKFPFGWIKDIMIICLYKEQRKRAKRTLGRGYRVLTVDSAQGKEAPIVIVLTTRTQKTTDFFCSPQRCNVAVSRQQKALIIMGKSELLTTINPWCTVVNGDDFTYRKVEDI